MGYWEYDPIAAQYGVPIVVTGFEPLDLLQGIYLTTKALEEGRAEVDNQYSRSVNREGNLPAQKLLKQVFAVCDRPWRGIGAIPNSGYHLQPEFAQYDAEQRFAVGDITAEESAVCIAGEIMQGLKKPHHCPVFGTECTPEHPQGAPMVSSEGACAAYYQYGRVTVQ
jgi:hydrogenase expression/formation protein HypD